MALVSMARNNGDFAAALRHARELLSLSGEKTLAELSAEFGVHPTMISKWKQELVKRAGELFARGSKASAVEDAQKVIDDLHRKIGQLQVERDFLAGHRAPQGTRVTLNLRQCRVGQSQAFCTVREYRPLSR